VIREIDASEVCRGVCDEELLKYGGLPAKEILKKY